MAGRKPKPTSLKVLQGTARKGRLNKNEPDPGLPCRDRVKCVASKNRRCENAKNNIGATWVQNIGASHPCNKNNRLREKLLIAHQTWPLMTRCHHRPPHRGHSTVKLKRRPNIATMPE